MRITVFRNENVNVVSGINGRRLIRDNERDPH